MTTPQPPDDAAARRLANVSAGTAAGAEGSMEEMDKLSVGVPELFDLNDPRLSSPK